MQKMENNIAHQSNPRERIKNLLPKSFLNVVSHIRYGRTDYPYPVSMEFSGVNLNFIIENPVSKHRLENYGGEKDFLSIFAKSVKPDSIVLDIGASLGLYSIIAAKKASKVLSVEPDTEVISKLTQNLVINETKNVICLPIAIGSADGVVVLHTSGANSNSPTILNDVVSHSHNISVPMERADTLVHRLLKSGDISHLPDIVKIDVEGYEIEVLKGMSGLLSNPDSSPGHIFIEVHPIFLRSINEDSQSVLDLIPPTYEKKKVVNRANECLFHFRKKC